MAGFQHRKRIRHVLQNMKESDVTEAFALLREFLNRAVEEFQPIFLLCDCHGAGRYFSPINFAVARPRGGKELSDAGPDVEQRSRLAGGLQFLQSALPEPVSWSKLLQPGIVFLLLGIESYQFAQSGPWIIEDVAAGAALHDVGVRINRFQKITVTQIASVE